MTKTALITGITGQDGSYLAELLLSKGYTVHGVIRRASTFNTERIDHIYQDRHDAEARLFLHYGELSDAAALRRVIGNALPDEIYHLGAQSHVGVSFQEPLYTSDVDGLGTLRLLEAVRDICGDDPARIRVYNACSSEMFGASPPKQNEETPFYPRSPYGVAKVASYWFAKNYREAYGLFISNGILFNHEGPRRGETFVTRKITRGLSKIIAGKQNKLYLGNLDAQRDWGYAREYVEGIRAITQHTTPDDFVLSTGVTHSVRDFLQECCDALGLSPDKVVEFDPRYLRPTEVDHLVGDSSKAMRELGWKPETNFRDLARLMLAADLEADGLDPTQYGLVLSDDKAVVQFP